MLVAVVAPVSNAPEAHVPTHTYNKPDWLCLEDGEPWPCAAKRDEYRARLDREGAAGSVRIRTLLGAHLLDAQRDLGLDDDEAYERFVAWSYEQDAVGR